MAKKRQPLSKKTRFEVFKRDGFKCQYCGAHPPAVVLHVDHIQPVALDGGNNIDNLITSCEPCNLGKGARSLTVVPQSVSEKTAMLAEREDQLRGYQEVLEARHERIESELWRVAELISPGSSDSGMSRDWTSSIRRFNEQIGVHECISAAQIARGRYPQGGKKAFLYFCGVCWNKVREGM